MDFILMKQNQEAAMFSIKDSITLLPGYDASLFPLHLAYDGEGREEAFGEWINHRVIPKERQGITEFLKKTPFKNVMEASLYSHSLSLSDPYWIKKENENISWENINFYTNQFPYDTGNAMFGFDIKSTDFISPDFTTNGLMKKTWRRKGGKLYLLKQGSCAQGQEAVNEALVSHLAEKLSPGLCVQYELAQVGNVLCSMCRNFLQEGQEFVPAYSIYRTKKRPFYFTTLEHLLERCKTFKIPGAESFIAQMIALDYVIANTDRHMGNFGFLRDIKTGKFIGPAPLFDNGASLYTEDRPAYNTEFKAGTLGQIYKHLPAWAIGKDEINEFNEEANGLFNLIGMDKKQRKQITDGFAKRARNLNRFLEKERERDNPSIQLRKDPFIKQVLEFER